MYGGGLLFEKKSATPGYRHCGRFFCAHKTFSGQQSFIIKINASCPLSPVGTRRGASAVRGTFSSAVTSLQTRTRHGASLHGRWVISFWRICWSARTRYNRPLNLFCDFCVTLEVGGRATARPYKVANPRVDFPRKRKGVGLTQFSWQTNHV